MPSSTCIYLNFGTFGFRTTLLPYLLIMATDPFDDSHYLFSQPPTATSTNLPTPIHQMEDITSASYIPRMARTIPHSTTVHTIFIKKITYIMKSRPDELGFLNVRTMGEKLGEQWRPSWRTSNFHKILVHSELRPINGGIITKSQQFRPLLL